jgi:hypothetical protein
LQAYGGRYFYLKSVPGDCEPQALRARRQLRQGNPARRSRKAHQGQRPLLHRLHSSLTRWQTHRLWHLARRFRGERPAHL